MAKLYGSLVNRFEEGKNFNKDKTIHVGDPITMYHWSDRTCYYVTEVIDQKHIKVREYEVVADRDLPGGMGHQNWLYFKTRKECNDYLKKYSLGVNDDDVEEHPEEEWVYRYNHWTRAYNYDKNFVAEKYFEIKEAVEYYDEMDQLEERFNKWVDYNFTKKEQEKLKEGKTITHYHPLESKVSFGVLSYYYDWSF